MTEIVMPKQKRSLEKRNAILKSGIELFTSNGYQHTTTVDIAKHAGVSTGIVYRYFPDKKSIFIEAVDIFYHSFYEKVFGDLIVLGKQDNINIEVLLTTIIDKVFNAHNFSKLFFDELNVLMNYDKEIANHFKEIEESTIEKIASLLPMFGIKASHSHEKIHVIYSLIESLVHESLYEKQDCKDYEYLKKLIIDTSLFILDRD